MDRGLQWLGQQVQPTGAISGEADSVAFGLQVRAETLTTLRQLSSAPTPLVDLASQDASLAVELLSRKITSVAPLGRDVSSSVTALLARQNADGGWGGARGYQSNPLDTAYALRALRAVGQAQSAAIGSAIAYLQAAQATDGSYSVGDLASVHVAAEALHSLAIFAANYSVGTHVGTARAWLIARQSQGVYPDTLQNAIALLALIASSTDTAPLIGPADALRAAQAPNGSWNGDAYVTALALRALAAAEEVLPPSTTGQVSGTVVEQASGGAIAGAQVVLTGAGNATVTTDGSGAFVAVGLAPGAYTLQVSKAGYSGSSLNANVAAGVTTYVGAVRLTAATTTATIQGTVRDGATGQPLSGAVVAITNGPSATTDANGAYQLGGLIPASVEISVSKATYQTVFATASIAAGVVYTFSPSLYLPGQTPTDAILKGRVVDRATSQAVQGASVVANGISGTTSATGDFQIGGLAAGALAVEIQASGYQVARLNGTLAPGVNEAGVISIDRSVTSAALTGRVFDAATNLPIGGANVAVQGTGLAGVTNSNGFYTITGITSASYGVAVSAAGYRPATVNVSGTGIADAVVDVGLQKASTGNVTIRRVSTDVPSYPPLATVEVEVEVLNAGATPVDVMFSARILNAAGDVVAEAPGIPATVPGGNVPYEVELEAHTTTLPAGTYSVVVTAFDMEGALLDEGSASFQVTTLVRLGGGITMDPPITQSGSQQAIRLTAVVANKGNAPIPAGQVELSIILSSAEPGAGEKATIELQPGVIAGGLIAQPLGAGLDSQGNLYTVNQTNRRVLRIAPAPANTVTVVTTLPATLTAPSLSVFPVDAIADAAGNVYVLNSLNEIFIVDPAGNLTRRQTGIANGQLAFDRDAAGNFYIAALGPLGTQIVKVPPSGPNTVYRTAGLAGPRSLVRGVDGDLYVSNRVDGTISRVTPAGEVTPFVISELSSPLGMTIDGQGNLYVTNHSGGAKISKITMAGVVSTYATGFPTSVTLTNLAFDSAGNLFVTSFADETAVYKVPPGGGAAQPFMRTLFAGPQDLQYDAAGNLYATTGSSIFKKDAADNVTSVYFGLNNGRGLALVPNGEIFVASSGTGEVARITTAGVRKSYAFGLSVPYGTALSASGVLYVTESGGVGNRVVSFDTNVPVPETNPPTNAVATVVAESLVNTPRWVRSRPSGERFVLNADSIARVPASGIGSFVVKGATFSSTAAGFALTADGGFLVQEPNAVKKVSSAGVTQTLRTGLPTLAAGVAADASQNAIVAVATGNASFPTGALLRIDGAGTLAPVGIATVPGTPVSLSDDGAGVIYVALSNGHIARYDFSTVSVVTAAALNPAPTRIAPDAAGNKLYLLSSAPGIRVFSGGTVTAIAGVTQTFSAIEFASAQLVVTNSATRELSTVSTLGQVAPILAGFTTPGPILVDGPRLIFSDSTRTFSVTPGGHPTILLGEQFTHLAMRSGVVYGTRGDAKVYSFTPGTGTASQVYVQPNTDGNMQGLAFRSDGLMTVASNRDNSAWSYDASGQLAATYVGISFPQSIAIDSQNNLYVGDNSNSRTLLIPPAGKTSRIFSAVGASGLKFDSGGQLHATVANTVRRIAADGTTTTIATVTGTSLFGILVEGGTIHVADDSLSMIRRVVDDDVVPFAVGVSTPKDVRIDPQGGVLVASSSNGSLLRLAGDALSVRAYGMTLPTSIAFAANGETLVGGQSGHIYAIGTDGVPQDIGNLSGIYGGNLSGVFPASMAVDGAGTVHSVSTLSHQVDRITYYPAGSGPQAGAVALSPPRLLSVPEIAVGDTTPTLDFGTWVPPHAGDFSVKVRPISAQVSGELRNVIHVGPHSTAQMGASPAVVPPGDSPVNVVVNVDGADFTSFARADPRGVTLAVPEIAGQFFTGMGADASGAIYIAIGDSNLRRYTATGGMAIVLTMPGQISSRGALPVDDDQNVYINAGAFVSSTQPAGREIHKVRRDPVTGVHTTTKIAELNELVRSMVRASDNTLYVLGANAIYHLVPGAPGALWTVSTVPTGALSSLGTYLTIDGKDNLYVLGGSLVNVYRPDGTRATVLRPDSLGEPTWEGEGTPMSGDCADNLLVAPYNWSAVGQTFEEHTLVQVVGRTGKVAQIFDGSKTLPSLTDMDSLYYDRFSSSLLIWTDVFRGMIFRLPLTCGAIDTQLHVVVPAAQTASGFSVAPKAVIARADGQREYVWGFKDVTTAGRNLGFQTTLPGMRYGESRAVATEAFLSFANTFANGTITVPVTIPMVRADGMVDLAVSTDAVQYEANTDVQPRIVLENRDLSEPRFGTLAVEFTDPQGARIAAIVQMPLTLASGQRLELIAPFNTGTFLTGEYAIRATFAATTGAELAKGSVGFYIVAGPVVLVPGLTTDRTVYEASDEVLVSARVRNVSQNALATGIAVQARVRDPAGQEILNRSASISSLAPQALKDSVFGLALAAAPAGVYTVEMTTSMNGVSIGDPLAARFNVLSTADTGSGLAGTVAVSRLANQGDPVAIKVTAANKGNAALVNLPVTTRVTAPASGTVVQEWTSVITLAAGERAEISKEWTATGVAAGTYVVTASATVGSRTIALGQDATLIGGVQPFAFGAIVNAALATEFESNAVVVSGIVLPAPISITEGEYRIGDGGWTATPGLVKPGEVVMVRLRSAPTFNTLSVASLTVAGFTAAFQVTTVNPDVTPDAFAFAAQSNVPLATVVTSNAVTIAGVDIPVPISITGGEYSLDGGVTWTAAAGMVASGGTVAVRLTSSASLGTTSSATLNVSGVTAAFIVTTTAEDRSPNAFEFAPRDNVARNTVVTSDAVTISGINVAVPISVVGGEYSINGGAFTAAPGAVGNGATVRVRLTSSDEFSTTRTATLTVSGVSANFSVTTEGADTTPDAFAFDEQLDAPLATVRSSNAVTVKGINAAVPVTVQGGEYSLNGGAFTAAAGTVNADDVVVVRQTSSSGFDVRTVATLTVSQLAVPFAVTTKAAADVPTVPEIAGDARLLVLVSCKGSGGDPEDAACSEQRRAFLDTYLGSLGVLHHIVTTNQAFKSEFRSGRYNAYWITGGADKLHGTLAEELREAAFRGDTLIVDGAHDERNNAIDEVAGVLYKGKPAQLNTVTLDSTFLPAGAFTVSGARPIRVELTTGLRQGVFNTGDPAISTNAYGRGHGLLFAFDLTGTLIAQAASELLRATLDLSLEHVTPAVPATYTGGAYVPLTLGVRNAEPVAVELEVVATLPAGFAVAAGAPPATVSGSTVRWSVALAAGESRSLEWAVRTPEATGSHAIAIEVRHVYGGTSVSTGTYTLTIEVRSADAEITQAIAGLQALTLASNRERSARDAAVVRLNEARAEIGSGAWEQAIAKLVTASERLDDMQSISPEDFQVAIGRAIREIERQWWAALPACPAPGACRSGQ